MEIASIIKISLITATGETVLQTLLSRAKKKRAKRYPKTNCVDKNKRTENVDLDSTIQVTVYLYNNYYFIFSFEFTYL